MVEYSLNQFPSHRHFFFFFLNEHFQFHLISQMFFIQLTPNIFRGNLPSEIVEELISVNFQVSECYCEFLYRQAVHTGFSLDVAGNTPTFQCKAAVSSVRKLLRVHSKFENAVNKCGK